jgi:hypothetical protein
VSIAYTRSGSAGCKQIGVVGIQTHVTTKVESPTDVSIWTRPAVAAVFFVNGAVLASWVPHIPMVQLKLGLSPAILGIALLGMAAGALIGIPLAGWWVPRLGSRVVVRASGDRLVARLGSGFVVRGSASLAAVGLGSALIVGHPLAAIAGCGCVGLGLSNLIPILFRAASQVRGINAGHGIAAVSPAGYCGFLAGPPLIGVCAELMTLPRALGIVVMSLVWIAASARRISSVPG